MSLVPEIELIVFDKRGGAAEYRRLLAQLAGREFDVMLHLQLAIRASLASLAVRAPVKLGFDLARAREAQWLFTTHRIAPRVREHVLDSMMGFAEALGATDRVPRWDFPVPPDADAWARDATGGAERLLVISPCSSFAPRNWTAARYAAVAEHAVRAHGLAVVVTGSPADAERRMAAEIERLAAVPVINLAGKDTLPRLLALLRRAEVLVSPDSGPAHMATMVGTPVVGLYAATNPARSGPYLSRDLCVDRFAEASRRFRGCEPAQLPWATKIHEPGVMELIEVDDVVAKLDEALARRAAVRPA